MIKSIFSRGTIIEACNILSAIGHSQFNNLVLKFELENVIPESGNNLQDKANILARYALQNPTHSVVTTTGTQRIDEAIVYSTIVEIPHKTATNQEFNSWLARDGFSIVEKQEAGGHPWALAKKFFSLERMHPEIASLTEVDDEVHGLLKEHNFTIPLGHLDQAISAHTRGEWASANSQLRTFVEGLFDDFAGRLMKEEAVSTSSGNPRRALLAKEPNPFFIKELFEWSDGNKPTFIEGLMNRLNPQGSHPGLSDIEDATFRLHVVLITARLMLRRYAVKIKK